MYDLGHEWLNLKTVMPLQLQQFLPEGEIMLVLEIYDSCGRINLRSALS